MSYIFLRRIRGPIFLLTFGVTALLHQWHVLSFGRSWPLYLIVFGVLKLVEGAALAALAPVPLYPQQGYAAQGFGPQGYGGAAYQPSAPSPGTGIATLAPAHIQTAASTEEES